MREDYVIFEYKDSDFEALSLKEQWNQEIITQVFY